MNKNNIQISNFNRYSFGNNQQNNNYNQSTFNSFTQYRRERKSQIITSSQTNNYLLYSIELQIQQLKLKLPFQECNIQFQWYFNRSKFFINNSKQKQNCKLLIKKDKLKTKGTIIKNNYKVNNVQENLFKIDLANRLLLQNKIKEQNLYSNNWYQNYVQTGLSINKSFIHSKSQTKQNQNMIKIILQKQGKYKIAGIVTFNLFKAIHDPYNNGLSYYQAKIDKCPDQNAKLMFSVKYIFHKEMLNIEKIQQQQNYSMTERSNLLLEDQKSPTNKRKRSPIFSPKLDKNKDLKSPREIINHFNSKEITNQKEKQITQLKTLYFNLKSQYHSKQNQLTFIKSQNQQIQKQINSIRSQNSQKLLQIMNQLNRSQQDKEKLLRQIKIYKSNQMELLEKIQIDNKDFLKKCQRLIEENQGLKNEVFKLQNQIIKHDNQFELKIALPQKQYKIQLQQTQRINKKLTHQKFLLESQLNQLSQKFFQLQHQLQYKKIQCQHLSQKIQKIQKETQTEKRHSQQLYKIMQQKYQQAMRIMSEKYQQVINVLEIKENQLEDVRNKYNFLQSQKNKEIQLLRKKFDSLRVKLDRYEEERKKSQKNG